MQSLEGERVREREKQKGKREREFKIFSDFLLIFSFPF